MVESDGSARFAAWGEGDARRVDDGTLFEIGPLPGPSRPSSASQERATKVILVEPVGSFPERM